MQFNEQHTAITDTMVKFMETEVNPYADEWEKAGIWPAHEILGKMGKLGLLGINKPEAYGGLALDYSYQATFLEALGNSRCNGVTMGITVQTDMATPALSLFGSDELRAEFLAPAIAGDYVASIAVSEAHAGSDVARIKTTAKKDGDDYLISGSKMWITNSTQADFLCLLANTDGDNMHTNKTLIVVPTKLAGISFSEKLDKLGMRASDTAQIFFDDVRVPQRYRIGEEGQGFTLQMQQFQEERLCAALAYLRVLENCISDTIDYTRQRHVFGKPVLDNQTVHFKMAELQTEIELLRALCYQAIEQHIAGVDVTLIASMAKLKIGVLSRVIPDACLQYWGGMGFMWDTFVSRCYRDLRLNSIGGGADEVMLQIIAKKMGTFPKKSA